MQASPASNETRLPRAVVRASAAIEERLRLQRESKPDPADPNAPPAEPNAIAADPGGAQPPAPATPPVDPRENDPEYWKQRFRVTEGVLRKEQQARASETGTLRQQIADLETQVRDLQAAVPPAPVAASDLLSQEQIDLLGTEEANAIVAAAAKAAREAATAAVEKEVRPLKQERATEKAQAEVDRKTAFTSALAEKVPDYESINAETGWLAWLAEIDGITGLERQTLLDNYVGRGDVARTASLFTEYKKSTQPPAPPVAPNGSGATPPGGHLPQPNALRAPTDVEVKDYFKRAAIGKVTNQERVTFEARMKLRTGR